MIRKAKRSVHTNLVRLTQQYFGALISHKYDDIYEELITDDSIDLLAATAWPLIYYQEGKLNFLIEPISYPYPEMPVHDALSMAFQVDFEECRTGLFKGLAESTIRQQWQNFDSKHAMCFVDGKAAILIADSPTIPVIMLFVKQDSKYLIDFAAYWLFSMGMRASIILTIASYALEKGQDEFAREFLEAASGLIAPYERLVRLMVKHPFVGKWIEQQRKEEILTELELAKQADEKLRLANASTETTISLDEYERILEIASSMAVVMERSPEAFAKLSEENIRQHFLVQLNGHYPGNATGETFNFNGKTDILVRKDNLNVFVAECKFWRGEKSFCETIDQLLHYATWRDTRLAIFIFNRNRNLSSVLEQIPIIVESHSSYIRTIQQSKETNFRFNIKHNSDNLRELLLTVLVFDVPA